MLDIGIVFLYLLAEFLLLYRKEVNAMKALTKKYDRPGLWLDEVPIPTPGYGEVLIKISKTAICGSDMHVYHWVPLAQQIVKIPTVIGHEFVGRIEECGPGVKGLEVGNLVSGEGHIVCGVCKHCRSEQRHLCPDTKMIGAHTNGAFAEYMVLPATNVWELPPDFPPEKAACLDPFGNAVHAALSFDLLGKDVLITGAGPIGIMAIAVVRSAGARSVVITDINPKRLELARQFKPDKAVDVRTETLNNVIKDLELEDGFDVGIEISGNPTAFKDMIDAMTTGGEIAMLGIISGDTAVNWNAIIMKGLTLKGIFGRRIFGTWHQMMSLIHRGVDISSVITHRFHYTDFKQAFELMATGDTGKVILDWTEP
jgi:threonine 3-dehydrogenase